MYWLCFVLLFYADRGTNFRLEVVEISDGVFQITCDAFDARLLRATIQDKIPNLVEFAMSVVKAAVKGATVFLYPTKQS